MNASVKKIIFWIVGVSLCSLFPIAIAIGFFQWNQWDQWDPASQYHDLRIQVLQKLIEKSFNHFVTVPFGPGNDTMHLTWSLTYPDYPDYMLNKTLDLKDDLDVLLEKKLQEHSLGHNIADFIKNYISFTGDNMMKLKKVYLFKNQQDLTDLWYVVSSYRTRTNNDRRKENIMISYWNIGNVRVLNPNQKFSFMDEAAPNPTIKDYKRGFGYWWAIMWGKVQKVVGWGICAAAWGINALILPNKAFEIETRYNHSITYKNLYKEEDLNGQTYWIPGLDAAVYALPGSKKDFVFKNIRSYPVILIMNADGSVGGSEEMFVLSKKEDRGSITYIGKKKNCYTRDANGKSVVSCYQAGYRW